jgi:hypothetical protein
MQEIALLCGKAVSHAGSHFAARENGFPVREVTFAVQENGFLCEKSLCCAGKRFPVREVTLLCRKTVSCTGNHFAVQENGFPHRK